MALLLLVIFLSLASELSCSTLRGNSWVKSFPETITIGASYQNLTISSSSPFRGVVSVPVYGNAPVSFLFEIVVDNANAGSDCVNEERGVYMLVREMCQEEKNYEKCEWHEDDDTYGAELKGRWKPIVCQNWTKMVDTHSDLAKNGLLNAAPDGMRSLWFAKSRYLLPFKNESFYEASRCGCSKRDPFVGRGWKDRSKSKSRYFVSILVADEIKKCDVHFRVRAVNACSDNGVWTKTKSGHEYGCECDLRYQGSFHNPSMGIFGPERSMMGCSQPVEKEGPGEVVDIPVKDKIGCFQTDVRGSKTETTSMSKDQQIACTGVQMSGKRSHREVKISTSGLSEDEIRYLDETEPSARLRNMLYRQG